MKPNVTQLAILKRIARLPYEAAYHTGLESGGKLRYIGTTSHAELSVASIDALARHGWVSVRKRLPRFKEGTTVVFVYEITALGRAMLT